MFLALKLNDRGKMGITFEEVNLMMNFGSIVFAKVLVVFYFVFQIRDQSTPIGKTVNKKHE